MSAIAASEQIVVPATNPAADASSAPSDCTPAERAERHYRDTLDSLLAKATEHRQLEMLVDAMAHVLARVVVHLNNSYVAGDVWRKLGRYTCQLALAREAEQEAAAAAREGRAPH